MEQGEADRVSVSILGYKLHRYSSVHLTADHRGLSQYGWHVTCFRLRKNKAVLEI